MIQIPTRTGKPLPLEDCAWVGHGRWRIGLPWVCPIDGATRAIAGTESIELRMPVDTHRRRRQRSIGWAATNEGATPVRASRPQVWRVHCAWRAFVAEH
jgi:hypothetical protein